MEPPSQHFPFKRHWLPTRSEEKSHEEPELNDFISLSPSQEPSEDREDDETNDMLSAFLNRGSGLVGTKEALAAPCVVLLGRPGSGKTMELARACQEELVAIPEMTYGPVSFLALNSDLAVAHLFNSSPWQKFRSRKKMCRLVLDGLDEGILVNPRCVDQTLHALSEEIREHGPENTHLILTCRSAQIPTGLIAGLKGIWGEQSVKAWNIVPLSEEDALAYATKNLASPTRAESFLCALRERRLTSFACWPQGLVILTRQFAEGKLPQSYSEAVKNECRRLAESYPSERRRKLRGLPDPNWSFRLGGRVAVAMTFSGRFAVNLDSSRSDSGSAIPVGDLCLHPEPIQEYDRAVELRDFHNLRHTDLFHAGESLSFNHQVHREFMAAIYLAERRIELAQLTELFGSESNGSWRHFPQLAAVAAWLAIERGDFLEYLLKHDPLILLRADCGALGDSWKLQIVDRLLVATRDLRALDPGIRHAHLSMLNHPALSDQLRLWIEDRTLPKAARLVALRIARECKCGDIASSLWSLFEDVSDPVRQEIANTLSRLAKVEKWDAQWLRVLDGAVQPDDYGEMLGSALDHLVPRRRSVSEVLSHLLPRLHFEAYAAYDFALHNVHDRIVISDIPAILERMTGFCYQFSPHGYTADKIVATSLRLALAHLDDTYIRRCLITLWLKCDEYGHRLFDHENRKKFFQDVGLADERIRQRWVTTLIESPEFQKRTIINRARADAFSVGLIEADWPWLLSKIRNCPAESKPSYARLICDFVWKENLREANIDAFHDTVANEPSLVSLLPPSRDGMSMHATLCAMAAESTAKWRNAENDQRRREADPKAVIESLRQAHSHDESAIVWRSLAAALCHLGNGIRFDSVLGVRDNPWMKESARRYLMYRTDGFPSLGITEHEVYGAFAIAVLWDDMLNDEPLIFQVREKWLPLLFSVMCRGGLGSPPDGLDVPALLHHFGMSATVAWFGFLRVSYAAKERIDFYLTKGSEKWNADMVSRLSDLLKNETVQPAGYATAIGFLNSMSSSAAQEVAEHHVESDIWAHLNEQQRIAADGAALFHLMGRCPEGVWQRLEGDLLWATKAIRTHRPDDDPWHGAANSFAKWPPASLTRLAHLLFRCYPPSQDENFQGIRQVSPSESHVELRNSVFSMIAALGCAVGIQEFSVPESIRDQEYLHSYAAAAQRSRDALDWNAVSAKALLELLDSNVKRLARSNDELQSQIMRCLRHYKQELAGHRLSQLIDANGPKHERVLSLALCDWLNGHLNVVGFREAELPSGERTDITVSVTRENKAPLTLVIEVKWDRRKDLLTAMENQLVKKYLAPRHLTHGLFVVGWVKDKPKATRPQVDNIEQAKNFFANQAALLSINGLKIQSLVLDCREQRAPSKQKAVDPKREKKNPSKKHVP